MLKLPRKKMKVKLLFATSWTVAYQVPPSMGFSRVLEWVVISFSGGSSQPRDQTQVSHIVGRRFTIWANREVLNFPAAAAATSLQSCPTLCDPTDGSPPGFSVHGVSQARKWVGSHFLLQGIFLTQGSNPGLPHCRQTLYWLSHQGSLIHNDIRQL